MAEHTQSGSVVLPEAGKRNVLVTSALPYVNNVPHLGNIIGSVLSADVFARYSRSRGFKTIFIGGTDEYGTSTETKAFIENCTERELCDKYHAIHADIYRWFNISFDIFGRTTTQHQTEIAQHIFLKLKENGHLKERTTAQLYCQDHSSFLADRLVEGECPTCGYADAHGDQCDRCGNLLEPLKLIRPRCKRDGSVPTTRDAKHMFLELDQLQSGVEEFFQQSTDRGAWSSNAESITKGLLGRGLQPLDITRNMRWGTAIPLPEYKDQVMYPWFDACIGYVSITANYTDQWERWWRNPEDVELYQFMGKDNAAFHSVVFPATQIGTGETWTKVHHLSTTEYLTYEGGKFSKSRGTGVFGDSIQKIPGVTSDAWRFNLLYDRPEECDSEFTWDQFIDHHNTELCDRIGAFAYETMQYLYDDFSGVMTDWTRAPAGVGFEDWRESVNEDLAKYIQHLDAVKLRAGLQTVISICMEAQDRMKGWLANPDFLQEQWAKLLSFAVNLVHLVAALIAPYMPAMAESINAQLGADALPIPDSWEANSLRPGHQIGGRREQPLFLPIDKEKAGAWRVMFGGSKVAKRAEEEPFGEERLREHHKSNKSGLDPEARTEAKLVGKFDDKVEQLETGLRIFATPRPEHSDTKTANLEVTPSAPQTPQDTLELELSGKGVPVGAFLASLPDFVDYLLELLPLPLREPPIPPGKGRVKWKCKCGANLYDDFTELEPGSLKDLEAELQAANTSGSQSDRRNTRNHGKSLSALSSLMKQMIRPMRRGSADDDPPLPLHNVPKQTNTILSTEIDILHLLCCIHSGDTGTILHQECISDVNTDRELIMFLVKAYQKRSSVLSWLSLRHVSKLLLSRFELDFSRLVQVHLHFKACQPTDCVCLPPLDHVKRDEYCCRPAPLEKPKYDPVFGDNYLIHYFRHPQCLSEVQTTIFNQLPKRAHGHLTASQEESVLGWGLYFEEGWHWKSIYFIVVILIITASLAFGAAWAVLKADTQSAFAITSSWITLGSLLLGYVAVRSL
ncbi:tRNA synthetases class I (M)-domain-containing protein [Lasiosphaeris hirsuta]|uniref:methionine--tRNA ligase n=1 Tax=Lasiosphaeris hirsuta TaxID=260670 RepID=A0AA40B1X4_9PEZI|nr:tRNA synthetases class I (M)-domain-containing protein [Lasiosphaeris hirsuta]